MKERIGCSGGASFSREGERFFLCTEKVQKTLRLDEKGRFYSEGYRDPTSGEDWMAPGRCLSDEFFITVDGTRYDGLTGGYTLKKVSHCLRSQQELEAVIILEKDGLEIQRHYVLYPGQPVVGEFTVYRNNTGRTLTVNRPGLFTLRQPSRKETDFSYMTGGSNFTGSLVYKTNPLSDGYQKEFDSHGEPELMEVEGKTKDDRHPVYNGTAIWCEFFTLGDRRQPGGLFVTFDYQGWWKARMTDVDNVQLLQGWCELLDYPLASGESLPIAPMTAGLWQGDMDDLGNTICEYVYAYKWDATNPRYFLEPTMTIWREAPLTEKVFRIIDTARYIGLEQIHVDDFWFDAKGNWDSIFGDDWKHNHDFMLKNGMDFRLWMPPWHADRLSRVWVEHPDWMCGWHGNWYNWTIDLSKEEAYQWVLNMLNEKQKEFGPYMLRVDGNPTSIVHDGSFTTSTGDYNRTYKQSENFYRLYREFKGSNPQSGLNGCSSGGHTLTIEATRYTESQQITDGQCGHLGLYYATLFCPVGKIRGYAGDMMQNPHIPYTQEQLEQKRKRCLMHKWLRKEGLLGRRVKVFRPELEHGEKTYLLQQMGRDCLRGFLTISPAGTNPILGKSARVFPKGLVPEADYFIDSLKGSVEPEKRTGGEWMEQGIVLSNTQPGEELYFNLQNRPGMGTDTVPPTTPGAPVWKRERWMGHTGVGVYWDEAQDDGILSYYELFKNGTPYTKISVGAYYFDDGADGADVYSVRAVDGDGNCSALAGGEKDGLKG